MGQALAPVSEVVWEIARTGDMRVPARVFADGELAAALARDHSLDQLVNVAQLPGIVGAAMGMPDMHEGYGFPVGGVAATALPDGAISPGGIGFDINCGVRLLASSLTRRELGPRTEAIVHDLSRTVPSGFGRSGRLSLDPRELDALLERGVPFLVERGIGRPEDVAFVESSGCIPGADASRVSERAKQRGHDQVGTLGGGNHFLEVQVVDEVADEAVARAFGIFLDQIVVLVHSGSRGLGHQVCTDAVRQMDVALPRHGYQLPDRQLACAPLSSPEGQAYFAAMAAAANFGFCNRHAIADGVRHVFRRALGEAGELTLVYDVAHNVAKIEEHLGRRVLVHRKGATRSFGPSSRELPERYRGVGQPVFIPGSMGTSSWVCVGTDEASARSMASACHGAGRRLSRGAARKQVDGAQLRRELEGRGISVRCASSSELAEEAPLAYKDVDRVVAVVEKAELARRVARLRPIGVVKG